MRRDAGGDCGKLEVEYLSGLWFRIKVSRQSQVLQVWLSPLLRLSSLTRITILQDKSSTFRLNEGSEVKRKKRWLRLISDTP